MIEFLQQKTNWKVSGKKEVAAFSANSASISPTKESMKML